jgi:hypothetical protein
MLTPYFGWLTLPFLRVKLRFVYGLLMFSTSFLMLCPSFGAEIGRALWGPQGTHGHPFSEVTKESADTMSLADDIYIEET